MEIRTVIFIYIYKLSRYSNYPNPGGGYFANVVPDDVAHSYNVNNTKRCKPQAYTINAFLERRFPKICLVNTRVPRSIGLSAWTARAASCGKRK